MEKIKRLPLIILLLFVQFRGFCDNNTLNQFFSNSDIDDIRILVNKFDQCLLNQYVKKDVGSASCAFVQHLEGVDTVSEFENELNFIMQQKEEILVSIKMETITKIWNMSALDQSFDVHKLKGLNLEGEYIRFLKQFAKHNRTIEEYLDSILVAGGVGPYGIELFQKIQDKLDVENFQYRFIIAVHYLSVCA